MLLVLILHTAMVMPDVKHHEVASMEDVHVQHLCEDASSQRQEIH